MKKLESVETATAIAPMDIRPLIYEIRGRQVMLDRDLAAIYQVLTKRLNEQVRRNIERFPDEFMFQLTKDEMNELVANCDRFKTMKHSSVAMTAFTEQGVAMLSAVLRSDIAVRESIRIIEAFAKQCGNFTKTICGICHDRFIIADETEIYWSSASLKDAGRLTFAAAKLGSEMIPGLLASIRKATFATNSYKKGGRTNFTAPVRISERGG